jgi:hypothetical protein
MIDFEELSNVFKSWKTYKTKCNRVLITKNMHVLLHLILKNLSYNSNGELRLVVGDKDWQALSTFRNEDLIDCYNRLNLDEEMYGYGISKKSRNYVYDKMKKLSLFRSGGKQ